MNYVSPKIEIEKIETTDIVLASGSAGGGMGGENETDRVSLDAGGVVSGSSGEVLTVGGLTGEGAVGSSLANNLFGIR